MNLEEQNRTEQKPSHDEQQISTSEGGRWEEIKVLLALPIVAVAGDL